MQNVSQSARMPAGSTSFGRREDLAYQAMTIGAIVTVLISVWVF